MTGAAGATDTSDAHPVFTGVGVALVTLFDYNADVDAKATAELAGQLVETGISAVVVAGTTGEAATLNEAERAALIREVRSVVPVDVPVLGGVGAPSGRQAAGHARAAVDAGADALLALSPPHASDPRPYYDAIAASAATLPVLAYHYPAVSPPGLPLALLHELPVVGVKDSSGDAERLLDEIADYDRAVYTGAATLLTLAGSVGAAGAILALANVQPELCIAAFGGDSRAQLQLLKPHRAARADFPAGIKQLTATRWGTSPTARLGT